MQYRRDIVEVIRNRINEQRSFIQVIVGPRQTGKTTAVTQALDGFNLPFLFVEATKGEASAAWLRAQWYRGRTLITESSPSALLVIDEVQYVKEWSAVVKTLWDEDARTGIDLRVLLTGSSATLLHEGLSESLAGRFETIPCTHWSYGECREAFGYSLDDFLFFGSYPGTAQLKGNPQRWLNYMLSSIIEPSISLDAMNLADVRKPELMRRLFELGAAYSGHEISYRKLLGQLDDRGNSATIAHYLKLLSDAGLMSGLQKYHAGLLREKASSPRLIVHNTALMTASYGRRRNRLREDPSERGHLIESAVGAYLIMRSKTDGFEVNWWRDGNDEVDFVISDGDSLTAIEVKSGRVKSTSGLDRFVLENPHARALVVGSHDASLEDFLLGQIDLFA